MKFKPWQETPSSSRSPFKVLPSFFLSPTRSQWLLLSGCGTVKMQHQVHFVLQAVFSTCTAEAPGSRTPETGLQREEWLPQQLRHTKKRAWPFLFNLRIFPRRCLAVAIPFFGRLPFVAWLLIGGGFDAGLLVGWRGTEKEVSASGLSGLPLSLLIWHGPESELEFCMYFPVWGLEPLLSTEFLLCIFWLISDDPSFLMHFWPLLRSWRLNLEVVSNCLIQEELLKSWSSVLTWYPHSTGLS